LDLALKIKIWKDNTQGQSVNWAYLALLNLLLLRDSSQTLLASEHRLRSVEAARRSLELVDETANKSNIFVRDLIRSLWLLGAAHRVNHNIAQSEHYLGEALSRCRKINMVDHEAYILIDLARLRCDEGKYEEAVYLAEEALIITERSSYVLQGADVHLLLAKLAQKGYTLAEFQDQSDRAVALYHARQARQLAECDGPPDYTYKVAYEEAGRMIESLDI
jgi:tetratricopeptide (TPR) repeat protein